MYKYIAVVMLLLMSSVVSSVEMCATNNCGNVNSVQIRQGSFTFTLDSPSVCGAAGTVLMAWKFKFTDPEDYKLLYNTVLSAYHGKSTITGLDVQDPGEDNSCIYVRWVRLGTQ